jgi:hypothetical protein
MCGVIMIKTLKEMLFVENLIGIKDVKEKIVEDFASKIVDDIKKLLTILDSFPTLNDNLKRVGLNINDELDSMDMM